MKIYISGPISGTEDYMERFKNAEKILKNKNKNFEIVNPAAENAKLPEGTSWETYMGESLKMLCSCDAIYMLAGWQGSRGASIEFSVAFKMGKRFYMEGEL